MDTPPPADGVSQALNPIVSKIREAFAVCGQGFMGLDLLWCREELVQEAHALG